ncbi:peptide chain release factor N(5)-glutamine methyltransferase [Aequorivita echinoideorum]|uniref:Release factor glutamine methyltransferase n=1 Tax=Aequorivita echinoideorum TaxID=1549647 RepID=A0ABS5S9N5_9FLAO|nr:peptide chain release factor N(5)-glutamine methyltransferase [Aequorivita echinoideorum]MBT0608590.1 peptide chain release factor N(5)-glutamine methyltransferase [Aequorivita echinoideorum]
MNLSALKNHFKKALSEIYPSEEVQSFFNILSEKYLNLSRIEIALNPEKEINAEDFQKFNLAMLRLKNHEPIQYIVGETEFYGLPFNLNKHTLIPRPETEELVEWILNQFNNQQSTISNQQLLDIGTGSGCIAISLAKNLQNVKVSAMDISKEALKMAGMNAEINNVEINFFEADILKTHTLPAKYDVIVSNPPYVRNKEKTQMQPNVLRYEPGGALFVSNEDPLIFYRAIATISKKHLKTNGKLFFEINEFLAEEMCGLITDLGFIDIKIKKDIFGKNRMLACKL